MCDLNRGRIRAREQVRLVSSQFLVIALVFGVYVSLTLASSPSSSSFVVGNSSTTVTTCGESAPPGALLVQVVSDDTNSSIQGATISGTVSIYCVVFPIKTLITPKNGTVTDFEARLVDGNYSLTISDSNKSYIVATIVPPERLTWVTLSVPSGAVKIVTTECYPEFMTICGYET